MLSIRSSTNVGFQSTPPVKAATLPKTYTATSGKISIHAAREGGDAQVVTDGDAATISIHAAREGGDVLIRGLPLPIAHFNPRRP